MPDYVTNMVGTSGRKCKCNITSKSWIRHWERMTNSYAIKCCAFGCGSWAALGAHVKYVGHDQRENWIVPFCDHHNKRRSTQKIRLKWGVVLASANPRYCF